MAATASEGKPPTAFWGRLLLVLLALLVCLALAAASLRHTGSVAFPIDDAYIYSNYVKSLANGHPFTYNAGETSGGITSLGWYFLVTVAFVALQPLEPALGRLAPPVVQTQAGLAQLAGHFYFAAYLVGFLCLAATALGTYRLAQLTLAGSSRNPRVREAACWLAAALTTADLGLAWGAMSGLEVPLSCAVVVWAVALLLSDWRTGRLRASLLLAALLPFARPDLVVISLGCLAWLLLAAVFRSRTGIARWSSLLAYGLATALGCATMAGVYALGWGKPLPSSFYAKVGGLRLGGRFFSALEEWISAHRTLPFVTSVLVLLSALVRWMPLGRKDAEGPGEGESRWGSLLLLICSAAYLAAMLLTLPWFGQEDRYLLPIGPFIVVLLAGGAWWAVNFLPVDAFVSRVGGARLWPVGAAAIVLLLPLIDYVWATRQYVVEVRNITDAHIKPALWLRANTSPDSVVASEPIGAVKTFSGRPTVDLVGLTTPQTLGTYRDWPQAWEALRSANAQYLLFYPDWFDNGKPPVWATEVQRYDIPDNRIAGERVISLYKIDWARYASR